MEKLPQKKNWGSFVHRGLRYDFLRKKIWTVPLILQFNIYICNNCSCFNFGFLNHVHLQLYCMKFVTRPQNSGEYGDSGEYMVMLHLAILVELGIHIPRCSVLSRYLGKPWCLVLTVLIHVHLQTSRLNKVPCETMVPCYGQDDLPL